MKAIWKPSSEDEGITILHVVGKYISMKITQLTRRLQSSDSVLGHIFFYWRYNLLWVRILQPSIGL